MHETKVCVTQACGVKRSRTRNRHPMNVIAQIQERKARTRSCGEEKERGCVTGNETQYRLRRALTLNGKAAFVRWSSRLQLESGTHVGIRKG